MELFWGFVVGLIFSTVGAAGGILAGVGHLSIFGIRDANLVKFYNQFLVALSPLISLPLYLKQKRVVFWLAFWLAVGSVLGASAGAFLSYQYLKDIRQYKYLFGLLTLFIGIKVLYEAFGSKKLVKTYKDLSTSLKGLRIELRQGEEVKSISIFNPFFVGFGIAMLSSAMGVGGWLFDSSLHAVGSEAFGLLCTWHCSFGRFYNHLDRHAKLLQAWCEYKLDFFV